MTSPPHVPPSECHFPHLREQLWIGCDVSPTSLASLISLSVSCSLGSRASNSPMKRDTGAGGDDSSPLIPDNHLADDEEHDRHSSNERGIVVDEVVVGNERGGIVAAGTSVSLHRRIGGSAAKGARHAQ
ncbi:hypothetical protein JHK87_044458 [Glycine soja]|nr:hypothetical protein JHK87_044458 [Glycine soja]